MCFDIHENSPLGKKLKEARAKHSQSNRTEKPCGEIFLNVESEKCIFPVPEPCIDLKLSIQQALSVISALDLLVHLGIGDIQFIKNIIDDGIIKKKVETDELAKPLNYEETDDIVCKLKEISALLGHGETSHFGIGNRTVSNSAKDCWEVKQVLSSAISSATLNESTKDKITNLNEAQASLDMSPIALSNSSLASEFVCEVTKIVTECMFIGEKDEYTARVDLKSIGGTTSELLVKAYTHPKNQGTLIADVHVSIEGESIDLKNVILGRKTLALPKNFVEKIIGYTAPYGTLEKLRSEITPPVNVLRDKWIAEYALLLVDQCHFQLNIAIEMGKSALENCGYDMENYSPSDAVDDEIDAMRSCI